LRFFHLTGFDFARASEDSIMFHTIVLLAAAALVAAQPGSTLPWGLEGKVAKITTIASQACSNKYINNTDEAFTIDDILCDKDRVPQQFQDYIPGLKFGPDSVICGGYACALRFLGCVDATYRVEAKIIGTTGKAESCADRVGLNQTTCAAIGKFITAVPIEVQRKRAEVLLAAPFTEQELADEVAAQKRSAVAAAAPSADDLHLAKLLIREYFPKEAAEANNMGLALHETLSHHIEQRKRAGFEDVLKQAQLCNPLISAAVDLAVKQFPAIAIVGGKFGPVRRLVRARHVRPHAHVPHAHALGAPQPRGAARRPVQQDLVQQVGAADRRLHERAGPATTRRTRFAPGTPQPRAVRAAQGHQAGRPDRQGGLLRLVRQPLRQRSVPSNEPPNPAACGLPTWPLCKQFKVEKIDAFQCCKSCVDVCKSNNPAYAANQAINCAAPPTEQECASQGKILGPKSPSSCCLTCVQPCDNAQCPDLVTREQCESRGLKFVFKTAAEAAVSKQCYDCCPRCEGEMTTTASKIKTEPSSSASTVVTALAAVVVATFSML
jgi:hypothetical protein